jgi:RimJ/RimL family protein N-acetyltransferase
VAISMPRQDSGALDPIELADGAILLVRPVGPEDKQLLEDLVEHLSADAARLRFFTVKHELTRAEQVYLTEIDHAGHEALLALEGPEGPVAGVVRYVRDPSLPDAAEASVLVADAWQGRGLGSALMRRLAHRARANGVRRFTAYVLAGNTAAMRLFERLGRTAWTLGDRGTLTLDVEL